MHFCAGQVPADLKTSGIIQDTGVIRAKVGETVTLKCFCQYDSATFFTWYQQSLGEKPLNITAQMTYQTEVKPIKKGLKSL